VFDLKGKVAVVTGSASGIGQAIAELFAARGAEVAILDVDKDGAEKTHSTIARAGGRSSIELCDVTDATAVDECFDRVQRRLGRIDILVNSAGIAHVGNILNTDESDFDHLYRVNVKGVFLCSRAAVKDMLVQGGGVILNLASIASLIGLEDRFSYSMTKGAVLTMTRSIAVDYVKQNIRCNCVCPARIHTPFVDGFLAANYPGRETEMFRELSEYQPVGRMGRPEEVAALTLYLCSDEAAFITGQAYPIDGGVLSF
jgi:NAD(P)-dependent dehydrogenase (short-subunit alcohol dehydrogenase family)